MLLAIPASAAPAPPNRTVMDARQAVHGMASCLMSYNGYQIPAYLAMPNGSIGGKRLLQQMNMEECLEKQPVSQDREIKLTFTHQIFRGAMAEQLLRRDFSAIGAPLRLLRPLPVPTSADSIGADPPNDTTIAMLAIGECAVRLEPALAWAIIDTDVATPSEVTAMKAFAPAIGKCIDQGQQYDLRLATVRAFVGEAAYRVAMDMALKPQASSGAIP